MKLNIPDCALDISDRFFKALDVLKEQRKIKGLQTFTKEFGLNYGNMNTLKHNRDKRTFRIEYLAYLAEGVWCIMRVATAWNRSHVYTNVFQKRRISEPLKRCP